MSTAMDTAHCLHNPLCPGLPVVPRARAACNRALLQSGPCAAAESHSAPAPRPRRALERVGTQRRPGSAFVAPTSADRPAPAHARRLLIYCALTQSIFFGCWRRDKSTRTPSRRRKKNRAFLRSKNRNRNRFPARRPPKCRFPFQGQIESGRPTYPG